MTGGVKDQGLESGFASQGCHSLAVTVGPSRLFSEPPLPFLQNGLMTALASWGGCEEEITIRAQCLAGCGADHKC